MDAPKWFMVDLQLTRRLSHFVPLSLLKRIATGGERAGPAYLSSENRAAIKVMSLFTRSRLSVQPVEQGAWDAVMLLGEKGGWDEGESKGKKRKREEEDDPKQRRVAKVEVKEEPRRRSSRIK